MKTVSARLERLEKTRSSGPIKIYVHWVDAAGRISDKATGEYLPADEYYLRHPEEARGPNDTVFNISRREDDQ